MKYIWYENLIPHVWKTFNLCKFNELLSRQIVHTKSHPLWKNVMSYKFILLANTLKYSLKHFVPVCACVILRFHN